MTTEQILGLLGSNPYSLAGNVVSGIGDTMDSISEQKSKAQIGRTDLSDFVVGDTWADIFNNSDRRNQGISIINDAQLDYSDVQNNSNLLNTWNANDFQSNINAPKVGAGQIFGNVLSDAGKGAGAGAGIGTLFGPLGTAAGAGIGAVVGTLSGITRGFIGNMNNQKNTTVFNKTINRANKNQLGSFYNTAANNSQRYIRNGMRNSYDEGGALSELNGVTKFNVGGSHAENPYDGIQQGIASDGLPNKVEQNEVKYNDYIYSARLKPSKKLLKDNLLPEKYYGLTYAKLAEKLQKESENRPNDNISKTTLDAWMSRLTNAQETHKQQLEERRLAKELDNMSTEDKAVLMSSLLQGQQGYPQEEVIPQQGLPQDVMQQGIDLGQPMYANGGKIFIKPENRGKFTALKERTGKSATWFKENGTPAQKKMATFALNAKHWNHKGALGMFLDEPDDILSEEDKIRYKNAAIDAMKQFVEGTYVPKDENSLKLFNLGFDIYNRGNDNPIRIKKLNNAVSDSLVIPSKIPSIYKKPDYSDFTFPILTQQPSLLTKEQVDYVTSTPSYNKYIRNESFKNELDKILTTDSRYKNVNNNSLSSENLRYLPAIGSVFGALKSALQPVDYRYPNELRGIATKINPIAAPTIGGYLRYTPYDVNLGDAINVASEAAAIRANRGQNRATQSLSNVVTTLAHQEARAGRNLAAQQANNNRKEAIAKHNLTIDQINAGLIENYDKINTERLAQRLAIERTAAEAADAARTGWSKSYNDAVTNMYNQLGNVGKDTWSDNQKAALLRGLGREGLNKLSKNPNLIADFLQLYGAFFDKN